MKKLLIFLVTVAVALVLVATLSGTIVHKRVVASWPNRIGELVAWVDDKSLSGALSNPRNQFGSYLFVGDYDIEVDFDWRRYGLRDGAAARVVLDENRKPLSVVFIDGSLCGIAIALRAENSPEDTFGKMPSDLQISSSRVGTFCVKRD